MPAPEWQDFSLFKSVVRDRVEQRLAAELAAPAGNDPIAARVCEAAFYAATGGHRWRAMVAIAAGRIFDEDALAICLPVGLAIELAHAASLVLDDLPSMDDATLRRGRPCTHVRFAASPWAVDLAPVFMINLAYRIALANERAGFRERVQSASRMSLTSQQMIAGQELDLTEAAHRAADDEHGLLACYASKAGALYAAAAEVGAITCGASNEDRARLHDAGLYLGLAYQYMDDVCDVVASSAESGKDTGMDRHKCTAVKVFGVDGARARARDYQQMSLERLSPYGPAADILRELTRNASWAPS